MGITGITTKFNVGLFSSQTLVRMAGQEISLTGAAEYLVEFADETCEAFVVI